MDGKIGGLYILPDQMQVINAVLILVFIPIFDKGLYPLASEFQFHESTTLIINLKLIYQELFNMNEKQITNNNSV